MHTIRTASLLVVAALAACTIRIPETTDDATGDTGAPPVTEPSAPEIPTSSGDPDATTDPGPSSTTTDPGLTSTTTDPGPTSTTRDVSTGAGGSTTTFPDLWPQNCDIWAQDCPSGQKCAPHTVPDGWYLETWCVPVVEDPKLLGDPCSVIDGTYSGRDDCEAGAFCWESGVEGGVCLALCTGTNAAPMCDDMHMCTIFEEDVLPLCLDQCHPLAQDCAPGDICIANQHSLEFMCVPASPRGDGGLHAPCESGNTCDPGLNCAYWKYAVECDEESGRCCERYCDLDAPNTCPGQGQVCDPWYSEDQAPEGFENVGTCAVPQ